MVMINQRSNQNYGKIILLIQILIVFLPLHNLLTFLLYKCLDNYYLIKSFAAWKELIAFLLIVLLIKKIPKSKLYFLLLGLYVYFILLIVRNSTNVGIQFFRNYGYYFILFFIGNSIELSEQSMESILSSIKFSALLIAIFGFLDLIINFGNILAS